MMKILQSFLTDSVYTKKNGVEEKVMMISNFYLQALFCFFYQVWKKLQMKKAKQYL